MFAIPRSGGTHRHHQLLLARQAPNPIDQVSADTKPASSGPIAARSSITCTVTTPPLPLAESRVTRSPSVTNGGDGPDSDADDRSADRSFATWENAGSRVPNRPNQPEGLLG